MPIQLVKQLPSYTWRIKLAAIGILACLAITVHAAAWADEVPYGTKSLQAIATTLLEQHLQESQLSDTEIHVDKVDSRLRLSPCQEAPQAFIPTGTKLQGKISIGIKCPGPKPWTVYVPAYIKVFQDVIASAHTLTKGSRVSANEIITVRKEVAELTRGYFTNPDDVIGKILTRPINAGQVFSPRRLKAPLLVKRGDEVTIVAASGPLEVRVKGKALEDAAKGEQLSVRNIRSKRVIQAVATDEGMVKINM